MATNKKSDIYVTGGVLTKNGWMRFADKNGVPWRQFLSHRADFERIWGSQVVLDLRLTRCAELGDQQCADFVGLELEEFRTEVETLYSSLDRFPWDRRSRGLRFEISNALGKLLEIIREVQSHGPAAGISIG